MVYTRLKRKNGLEHPETLRAMNELADLYLDSGKQVDAFQLSNETLIIELRIMGELDPMTLQTRYRIGKLHYLADRKEEAMEELGDVLAKQEKLLGFDHSEVTIIFRTATLPTKTTPPLSVRNSMPPSSPSKITRPYPAWKYLKIFQKKLMMIPHTQIKMKANR